MTSPPLWASARPCREAERNANGAVLPLCFRGQAALELCSDRPVIVAVDGNASRQFDAEFDRQEVDARPGTGLLEIARAGRRSVVRRAYATSPLRLLTPRNHGTASWVYTGSYGGGLVGGDVLRLTVRVGRDAAAFVSTQASTKVYRSDSGTAVELSAAVGVAGVLVLWPDPVVCFSDSSYQQRQHVELEDDAALVVIDWVTSGRRASGERWRFREYSSRLTVRSSGRLVLLDSLSLRADDGELAERMGQFDVLCSAMVVGARVRGAAKRIIEDVSRLPVEPLANLLQSAAPVAEGGCILRVAGVSVEQVARVLRGHLAFVPEVLGDDPWLRKW